jgi:hypothetical protein
VRRSGALAHASVGALLLDNQLQAAKRICCSELRTQRRVRHRAVLTRIPKFYEAGRRAIAADDHGDTLDKLGQTDSRGSSQ